MRTDLLLQALGVWVVLLVLMVMNGIIREATYGQSMGEGTAHVLSTVIAIVMLMIVIVSWMSLSSLERTTMDMLLVGILWLALTVVFEFSFGHYVAGHSWEHLINDYDLTKGRVWSLFLISIVLMPPLLEWLMSRRA